jgi:hypothetical protein
MDTPAGQIRDGIVDLIEGIPLGHQRVQVELASFIGAPNLAARLPQCFMLKVHDLFRQGGEHAPGCLMLAYSLHIVIKGVEEHV